MKMMRYDAIATIAALGSAFAIFQSFDAFVDFCRWLQPLVFYWRYYIYLAFDYLFFWLPFGIPETIKDVLAAAFLIGGVVIRCATQSEKKLSKEIVDRLRPASSFYIRTVLLSCGAVLIFFLAPVFGWVPDHVQTSVPNSLEEFFSFLPIFIKVFFSIGVFALIILISDDDLGDIRRETISHQMWRIIMVIATLVIINQIGLWADDLRPLNEFDLQPQSLESGA